MLILQGVLDAVAVLVVALVALGAPAAFGTLSGLGVIEDDDALA